MAPTRRSQRMIAVIGGSGLYEVFEADERIEI
jgi:purine nucleoside phosphorylase